MDLNNVMVQPLTNTPFLNGVIRVKGWKHVEVKGHYSWVSRNHLVTILGCDLTQQVMVVAGCAALGSPQCFGI